MLKTVFSNRTSLINHLIHFHGYRSYLEIGASKMANFSCIECKKKVSVEVQDLGYSYDYFMDSDSFFNQNKDMFDIIFVDGSHQAEQVESDILNSLKILKSGGRLVLDDTNPMDEFIAGESYNSLNPRYPYWDGTVWKAIFHLRSTRSDLVFSSYDEQPYVFPDGSQLRTGLTVIRRGAGRLLNLTNRYYSYSVFAANRNRILNSYGY